MHGHIKLQVPVGDFDPAFIKQLPALERAMVAEGLDPAAFVIAKDRAQAPALPLAYRPDGHPIEYTVFVKGRSFTVTQPDDLSFLADFYRLCVAATDKAAPVRAAPKAQSAEQKLEALIGRLESWFEKPI